MSLLSTLSLTDPSTLCLVVLMAAIAFLLMRANRRLARGRGKSGSQHFGIRSGEECSRQATNAPDELSRWNVEMHETARAIAAQLDTKMSALRALVAEADRAAARLEAAQARAGKPRGHQAPRPNRCAQARKRSPSPVKPQLRCQQGRTTGRIRDAVFRVQGRRNGTMPRRLRPRARQHDEIYTLADYGFDSAEIARRLGAPIGEVKLILNLRARD